ncbi:hypothetical protein TMCBR2_gp030c [Caulobacter phage TMCBR2]|uniref:Uncharacterized protein n=1 Tax=Caulobacter phage TMCBR2 TaxID=3025404 RepID=A0AAE9YG32_9CAUD|nr:hypothetical protein TMCBR2_gp030c [Caulobacter phage TMCBR2]WDS38278.1 hypothetical protein TMCBR3_gp030c [Caulobacter phage TMCBR3]
MTVRPSVDVLADAVANYATASNLRLEPDKLAAFVLAQLTIWGWSLEPSRRVTVDADWLAGVQAALANAEVLREVGLHRRDGLTIQDKARAFDDLARALNLPLPRKAP